jgi:hypothetical protein
MKPNFKSSLESIIQASLQMNIITLNDIRQMTDDNIFIIENMSNISLPVIYKDFLYTCGNGCGKLLDGSILEYGSGLLGLREQVEEMIEEDVEITYDPIPENAFFFASTLGAHYWFFLCDENPDPIVYYMTLSYDKPESQGNLSAALINALQGSMRRCGGSIPDVLFKE